ncbi:MAG: helix-turn-helix transcriptional regulator [Prolixibacteraceae bacterium]|nr:helix-turn-helix transcriptional regulator [Prolixibacteraceae bacterium]
MEQQAFKILKSVYFKRPVLFVSFTTVALLISFSLYKPQTIFPDYGNFKSECYTDDANGGFSQIIDFSVSDSLIKLKFQLKEGFQSPYAGFSITPIKEKYINAGKYNNLKLTIKGENIDRVGVALYTPPLEYFGNDNDETLYHTYLNISSEKRTYNISLNQLKHPEWWEDVHQISESAKTKPEFDKILHINIGSAFSPSIDSPKTLSITSIEFSRDNSRFFMILGIFYIAFVCLLFGVLLFISYMKKRNRKITVSYKPLEISIKVNDDDKCIDFINNNYFDSELSLEKISIETGISERRISSLIHEKYNCNFKAYLNRLRINESKRFLEQTDLSMGEIAFKVGFNNQSNFNRVFKGELNISPTEYREKFRQ